MKVQGLTGMGKHPSDTCEHKWDVDDLNGDTSKIILGEPLGELLSKTAHCRKCGMMKFEQENPQQNDNGFFEIVEIK
jgi:hypothetical protein